MRFPFLVSIADEEEEILSNVDKDKEKESDLISGINVIFSEDGEMIMILMLSWG